MRAPTTPAVEGDGSCATSRELHEPPRPYPLVLALSSSLDAAETQVREASGVSWDAVYVSPFGTFVGAELTVSGRFDDDGARLLERVGRSATLLGAPEAISFPICTGATSSTLRFLRDGRSVGSIAASWQTASKSSWKLVVRGEPVPFTTLPTPRSDAELTGELPPIRARLTVAEAVVQASACDCLDGPDGCAHCNEYALEIQARLERVTRARPIVQKHAGTREVAVHHLMWQHRWIAISTSDPRSFEVRRMAFQPQIDVATLVPDELREHIGAFEAQAIAVDDAPDHPLRVAQFDAITGEDLRFLHCTGALGDSAIQRCERPSK